MATYNGERFLAAQLQSLAAQTATPLELIVCDDGSTDKTLAILNEFAAEAPFPVRIHRNETRLGGAENFLKAASLCSGKWIGFCDQDDVWSPNKLEIVAEKIAALPSLTMVIHSADCTDEDLRPLGVRLPDFKLNRVAHPLSVLPSWAGFATVFRVDLLQIGNALRRPPNSFDGESRYGMTDGHIC